MSQLVSNSAQKSGVKIISSDLKRTKQTTQIISDELRKSIEGVSIQTDYDDRLREFHCGLFENMTYEEFVLKNPDVASEYMKKFDEDVYATKYPGPGGESRLDVMNRVGRVLFESHTQPTEELLVWVIHGGVIDVLLELAHIQDCSNLPNRIAAGNGDILVLQHEQLAKPGCARSVELGHSKVWRLERHYRIGDTRAAKVVR
ncbi:histidine phosphatase family protein [bacterium]|nr:histidine phosphatase family protein [bacterium]